jgi:hypothetical protein
MCLPKRENDSSSSTGLVRAEAGVESTLTGYSTLDSTTLTEGGGLSAVVPNTGRPTLQELVKHWSHQVFKALFSGAERVRWVNLRWGRMRAPFKRFSLEGDVN